METLDRPHILTDNETYGSKQRPPDDGGAWIVFDIGESVCAVFSNRQAATDYILDRGSDGELYTLSVWAIHDTYPWPEEPENVSQFHRPSLTVERAIANVNAGKWSVARGAEEAGISMLEFEEILWPMRRSDG